MGSLSLKLNDLELLNFLIENYKDFAFLSDETECYMYDIKKLIEKE